MSSISLLRGVSAGALLLAASTAPLLLAASAAHGQQSLPEIDIGASAPRPVEQAPRRARPAPRATTTAAPVAAAAPGFDADKKQLPVYRQPTGQTFTSVNAEDFKGAAITSLRDVLQYSPGLSFKNGNSAWDTMISIRGSTARFGFAIRNIVMLEDGFPATPPSGFSRTDGNDPHFYSGFDVYRGPSSALFGNYANGGALNLRSYTGGEIDGAITGHEFGSFGDMQNYALIGKKYGPFELAVYASDRRTDGFINHFDGNSQNVSILASYEITPTDKLTFKANHNELFADQSPRLSLAQFYLNPYQRGCWVVSPLCGQASVFANGTNGAKVATTANIAGFHRNDRRDIIGLRWEHDFDADTKWRTQFVYDDGNINQPTGSTSALSDSPSITATTDITRHARIGGHESTTMLGAWFSRMTAFSYTDNVLPVGDGAHGAIVGTNNTMMENIGARAREELELSRDVTGVLGVGVEMTKLASTQNNANYDKPTPTSPPWAVIAANHVYWNVAPEASVVWRIDPQWTTHLRASSGYGAPYYSQLFATQTGVLGDNSDLKTQRNTGFDIGADWSPNDRLRASLTLFHEWYQNEQITQSPGAGLLSYTFNAPASVHRGVEAAVDWRPFDGWRLLANYSYNNQIFTNFQEKLAGSATSVASFNRAGYQIPGVAPHELTARLGYDQPSGDLKGLGAYVEYVFKSSYFIDNGNLLTIPGFGVVNLNMHYDRDVNFGFLKNVSVFFEVRNVASKAYVASANNVTSTATLSNGAVVPNGYGVLAASTGSIYAGAPRAFQGGVKFKF